LFSYQPTATVLEPAAVNTADAARFTGLSESLLEKKRVEGTGPRFIRYGRRAIRYRVVDLIEWMERHLVSSTSEPLPN
jgi:predicted DNA-binding transcriptional regulator AlpA